MTHHIAKFISFEFLATSPNIAPWPIFHDFIATEIFYRQFSRLLTIFLTNFLLNNTICWKRVFKNESGSLIFETFATICNCDIFMFIYSFLRSYGATHQKLYFRRRFSNMLSLSCYIYKLAILYMQTRTRWTDDIKRVRGRWVQEAENRGIW